MVDGKSGLCKLSLIVESHLKTWNSMPAEVKAIIDELTKEVMSKEATLAKAALDNWNLVTPQQKVIKDTGIRINC